MKSNMEDSEIFQLSGAAITASSAAHSFNTHGQLTPPCHLPSASLCLSFRPYHGKRSRPIHFLTSELNRSIARSYGALLFQRHYMPQFYSIFRSEPISDLVNASQQSELSFRSKGLLRQRRIQASRPVCSDTVVVRQGAVGVCVSVRGVRIGGARRAAVARAVAVAVAAAVAVVAVSEGQ